MLLPLCSKDRANHHPAQDLRGENGHLTPSPQRKVWKNFWLCFGLFVCFNHALWNMGSLVPWPGIEPMPSVLGVQNLNHWMARSPYSHILNFSLSSSWASFLLWLFVRLVSIFFWIFSSWHICIRISAFFPRHNFGFISKSYGQMVPMFAQLELASTWSLPSLFVLSFVHTYLIVSLLKLLDEGIIISHLKVRKLKLGEINSSKVLQPQKW